MISERDLNKCIENLAEINANINNSALKHMILEVGYILKQELDNVKAWNRQFQNDDRNRGRNIDVNKLLADNNQLFNENCKLNEVNLKLKEIIDHKIPNVEETINGINSKLNTFSEILTKV